MDETPRALTLDLSRRTLSSQLLGRLIFDAVMDGERGGPVPTHARVNQRTYDNYLDSYPVARLCPDPDGESIYGVRLVVVSRAAS